MPAQLARVRCRRHPVGFPATCRGGGREFRGRSRLPRLAPVTPDLTDKHWLEALVASELDQYDPEAARARLPEEVRAAPEGDADARARLLVTRSLRLRRLHAQPEAAFEDAVRGHVQLVLDLALAAGAPADLDRRRAELAAFLAAASGARRAALSADPASAPAPRAVTGALRTAASAFAERLFPPTDPLGGLPLFPGALAVSRRHIARIATGHLRHGRLELDALARHAGDAEREAVLLAEALSGAIGVPADRRQERLRRAQLDRLGLSRQALGAARGAIARPRPAAALGVAVPETVRPFLLEQLALAQLRTSSWAGPAAPPGPLARTSEAGQPSPAAPAHAAGAVAAYVEAFAAAGGFAPEALAAARVEAAAQHGDHLQWAAAVEARDWQAIADAFEARTDVVVERVTAAVTDNLGALVTELRETGELGQLLARAAAGQTLTADERRKVKAQLIDVAKAVPALAIFAAPGGMLLLPLLAKLLPFSMLPSAWEKPRPAPEPVVAPALPPAKTGSDPE